ncbi:hypothetical protein F4781DRAFT_108250 [Annulohypoxylon bovei var. microspora]|nr:hypothetical protein F4781DRAFT_108250 [Annulohypoxylon bovei var. microspora]
MAPSREQLLKTTNLFLEAFNEFTPDSVVRFRSSSCRQRLLPATLKSPPQNNAEYAKLVSALQPLIPSFRISVVEGEEPAVDEVTRKVTLHLKSHSDTTIGLYQNESIWIITFNQDGTEIDDILEFADSLYTNEWLPKLVKAAGEAAKK